MAEATTTTNAAYDFTGDPIEACSCFTPCQGSVADDPDGGARWSWQKRCQVGPGCRTHAMSMMGT
jgi:hypothetical protein